MLSAQDKMSLKLNNWARSAERNNSTQEVWLQFDAQLDFEALDKDFRTKNYTNSERALAVIKASKESHKSAVNQLLKSLNGNKIKEGFWLGNSIIVELDRNDVLDLSRNRSVRWMELTTEHQVTIEDVEMEQPTNEKDAINGAEPGLKAINAHKMWARGYTGKGRKALIVDTGVWPTHPSISDAWVGNRDILKYSWYGFDSPSPLDKGNSHGTHVTGTVLGLDPKNNDTVGVAFDATFMAADPIASQADQIKGLYSIVRAYQWVLDPDNGFFPSRYKHPDVINNSWGHPTDTAEGICFNPFGDAVAACQLAGMAVVWSAGNAGPGLNTIGSPATITKNPYLVFTVGAIDANNSTYPIAGFSSRGPSYCAHLGIDSIKPEVVAPGVSVRSAIGTDGYANYQGTSMAGPHVSGAVLLLKEAFPTLPGQDILEAIYKTAIDLGPVGEDITYGNGMIDVDSAFLWLAARHVVSAPLDYSQDVSINLVSISESGISCSNEIEAEFRIINYSDSVIDKDSFQFLASPRTGGNNSYKIDSDIQPKDSLTIKVSFTLSVRNQFYAQIGSVGLRDNPFNNIAYGRYQRVWETELPFTDDFSNRTEKWLIDNPDDDPTWSVRVWKDENKLRNEALQLEFNTMNQRNKQQDFLISPKLMINGSSKLQMSFDYAYTSKSSQFLMDSLSIEVTSTCNSNWASVWSKKGAALTTIPDTTILFVPKSNEWKSATIDLSDYDDSEYIQVRFVGTNDFGNNLYIDNVAVTSLQPVKIRDTRNNAEIIVFPNPSNGLIELQGDLSQFHTIQVIDIAGKLILENKVHPKLDISTLENGIYFLELVGDDEVFKTKIIKE